MREEKVYLLLTLATVLFPSASTAVQSQLQSQLQHEFHLMKFTLSAQQPSSNHRLAKGHRDTELPAVEI